MAEPLPPIGFWSYTSSDDQHSDGRLSQLRVLLARELQLLVGQRPKVHIFQDVAAITHGSDWAEKIHEALSQSSFLIPIVTPGFMQSEWCCKEVMQFREREEALGRKDLIFPFRYIGIEDVDPDDPKECYDPAVFRLLESRQRFDFTPLRFHEARGQEVATQLAALARSVRTALRVGAARSGTERSRWTREWPEPNGAGQDAEGASRETPSRVPFAVWRDRIPGLREDACPEMITLPAGRFTMGAPESEVGSEVDERPQRTVIVPSFALGRYAVTFAQWDAAWLAGAPLPALSDEGWGRADRPVINVSWHDAQAYCGWLNDRIGLTPETGYHLPTEAEWEYACRAGTATPFSFGKSITTHQANCRGNFTYWRRWKGGNRNGTVTVGSLPANAWGLHEMHGNVWEWCEDLYGRYPDRATSAAALHHDDTTYRVLRGGSWCDYTKNLSSAFRNAYSAEGQLNGMGFRLARTLSP